MTIRVSELSWVSRQLSAITSAHSGRAAINQKLEPWTDHMCTHRQFPSSYFQHDRSVPNVNTKVTSSMFFFSSYTCYWLVYSGCRYLMSCTPVCAPPPFLPVRLPQASYGYYSFAVCCLWDSAWDLFLTVNYLKCDALKEKKKLNPESTPSSSLNRITKAAFVNRKQIKIGCMISYAIVVWLNATQVNASGRALQRDVDGRKKRKTHRGTAHSGFNPQEKRHNKTTNH